MTLMEFINYCMIGLTGSSFIRLVQARSGSQKLTWPVFLKAVLYSAIWMAVLLFGLRALLADMNQYFAAGAIINLLCFLVITFLVSRAQKNRTET